MGRRGWRGGHARLLLLLQLLLLLLLPALRNAANPFNCCARTATIKAGRRPVRSSSSSRSSAFMNVDGHEGQRLGRSGLWSRFCNATEAVVEIEKQATGNLSPREKIALEGLEHRVAIWLSKYGSGMRVVVKGLTGAILCCAGTNFGRCVILCHSLRVTGWPLFKRAVEEFGNSYVRARKVVKDELGQVVVRPQDVLKAVRYEIAGVRRVIKESQGALQDGKRLEARATIKQAAIDMKRLSYEAWVVNQALDSLAAFFAAVDVAKLKDVLRSVYTGALACIASANSVQVRKLSLSFDLGGILARNTHCVAQSIMDCVHAKELARVLPPETRRFLRLGISTVGALEGLIIVHTLLPRMSVRVTSAALGGAWLAEALAETLDPRLREHGWPVIEGRLPYCILSAGFTAGGYIIQKRQKRLPILIDRALLPLTCAEQRLKALRLFQRWG